MHSSTAPITALEPLPALDRKQLLNILLRSIPSAQHRSDLEVAQNDEDMIDQLIAPPSSREASPSSNETQNNLFCPEKRVATPIGLLKKVEELFGLLAGGTVKVEEEITQLDVKMELDAPAQFQKSEAIRKTSVIPTPDNTDQDDDMEVEYMVIAKKCITAATSVDGTRDRSLEHQRRNKRCVGGNALRFLTAPPVIKRRRQVKRLDRPRRKLKGVPGFR